MYAQTQRETVFPCPSPHLVVLTIRTAGTIRVMIYILKKNVQKETYPSQILSRKTKESLQREKRDHSNIRGEKLQHVIKHWFLSSLKSHRMMPLTDFTVTHTDRATYCYVCWSKAVHFRRNSWLLEGLLLFLVRAFTTYIAVSSQGTLWGNAVME